MRRNIVISMLLFLLLSTFSFGKESIINYKATFGIFGTVGTIKNKLTKDTNTYRVETTVALAGIAKALMGGQIEYYVSEGRVKNGLMISDKYTMTSLKNNQKKVRIYTIDHKRKRVKKRYIKWVNGKKIKDYTGTLDFYAKNDLLTLYFNMGIALKGKGKVYHFKAVGLEKQKGLVSVTVPNENEVQLYKNDLGQSADWYAKAEIVQQNFKGNKGNILMSVDEDGFIKKAVIKDVMMYGDAQLIRIH